MNKRADDNSLSDFKTTGSLSSCPGKYFYRINNNYATLF